MAKADSKATPAARNPKTTQDGQARAIKLLHTFRDQPGARYAAVKIGSMFDAEMRDALTWPAPARRGFTYVVADWLATAADGMSYTLDDYETVLSRRNRGTDVAKGGAA